MVIERYTRGPGPVYERFAERGRMMPAGLAYLDSWIVANAGMDTCFQLMEASDPALLDAWFERWSDLVTFEVHPVISSAEAAARTAAGGPGDSPSGTAGLQVVLGAGLQGELLLVAVVVVQLRVAAPVNRGLELVAGLLR
jgi:hypothetical protein